MILVLPKDSGSSKSSGGICTADIIFVYTLTDVQSECNSNDSEEDNSPHDEMMPMRMMMVEIHILLKLIYH